MARKRRKPFQVNLRRVPKDTRVPAEKWIADYCDDVTDTKHPLGHRHQFEFDTEREALQFADRVRAELREGVHTAPATGNTMLEAAMRYIQGLREEDEKRDLTIDKYQANIENYLTGWFPDTPQKFIGRGNQPRKRRPIFQFSENCGGKRMPDVLTSELDLAMVNEFRAHLIKDPHRTMASEVWISFGAILDNEIFLGKLTQNIVRRAKRIMRPERAKLAVGKNVWTVAEVRKFIAALAEKGNDGLQSLAMVSVFTDTGLRPSELLAIPLQNYNQETGKLIISQALDVRGRIKEPKTEHGHRSLILSSWTIEILNEYLKIRPQLGDAEWVSHMFKTTRQRAEEAARLLVHYEGLISNSEIVDLVKCSNQVVLLLRKYLGFPRFCVWNLSDIVPALPPDTPTPVLPYHQGFEVWYTTPAKAELVARYLSAFPMLGTQAISRRVHCRSEAVRRIRKAMKLPSVMQLPKRGKLPPPAPDEPPILPVWGDQENQLLFTSRQGRARWYKAVWLSLRDAQIKAGIVSDKDPTKPKYPGLHKFRHFWATEMANDPEVSIKWLQEKLGHAKAGYTLDIYAHFLANEKSDREKAERAGARIHGGLRRPELVAGTSLQAKLGNLQADIDKLLEESDKSS
jgi:integrase